jgi:hypothetical protein
VELGTQYGALVGLADGSRHSGERSEPGERQGRKGVGPGPVAPLGVSTERDALRAAPGSRRCRRGRLLSHVARTSVDKRLTSDLQRVRESP